MTATSAIGRVRRDLVVGTVARIAMVAAAVLALNWSMTPDLRTYLLVALAVAWIGLGVLGSKGSALTAQATSLIATGRYDEAEDALGRAVRSFSLSRPGKLLSLHQLAVLRHLQRRWPEAAQLASALLRHRLGPLSGLGRSARLILAEASLRIGDLPTTFRALTDLYRQRLPLTEAAKLLAVQLEYEARVGAWDAMLIGLSQKVQMTELMNGDDAARALAVMADAARHAGRLALADWFGRRAGLLAGPGDLDGRPADVSNDPTKLQGTGE